MKRPIAWLLIALLTIVAGLGEGLHSLPGCGHALRVGEVTVLLGVTLPESQRAAGRAEPGQAPIAHGPHDDPDIPIHDEDLCPICSTMGKVFSSTDAAQFVFMTPLIHPCVVRFRGDINSTRGRLFQARAPPLV